MRAFEFLTEQQLNELFGLNDKKPFQPERIRQQYLDPTKPWATGEYQNKNQKLGGDTSTLPSAVKDYVGTSFGINKSLVNQKSILGVAKNLVRRLKGGRSYTQPIKELDAVLAKSLLPQDTVVYHGTHKFSPGELAAKGGGKITIPSYTSTSTDKNVAYHFSGGRYGVGNILEISLKKGQPAYSIGGSESEILLPRNLTLQVDPDPTELPGPVYIWHATVVPSSIGELDEMALPADWDAEALGHDKTFKSRLDYVLQRAPRLGGGSSRVAFVIPDNGRETVLKVAKNKKGMAQNEAEVDILDDGYLGKLDIVIPLVDYDRKNPTPVWIQTEKANKVSQRKLTKMLHCDKSNWGMTLFLYAVYNVIGRKSKYMPALDKIKQDLLDAGHTEQDLEIFMDYVDKVAILVSSSTLLPDDFGNANNWGEYQGNPVIIDLGFTSAVHDMYWKR